MVSVQNSFWALLLTVETAFMANIWQQIRGLFQAAEASSPSQPAIHRLIERSQEEQQDYDFWKDTLVCDRLMNWISSQYAIYLVDEEAIDEGLDFLNTPSSKGFAVHFYRTQYSNRDVIHLLDHLKNRVQASLNYRKQISDMRTYNRPNWVESTQRHYLKPRLNFESDQALDQQFGNILIELVFRNDKPYQLKFQTTTYSDRQFAKAGTFKDLMNAVFV